jgi:hypothetical protein
MAKPVETAPPEKIALYEKLVATNPKIERKGATVPYTSLNGNMFSYLSKAGKLALRLPTEPREAAAPQTRVPHPSRLVRRVGYRAPRDRFPWPSILMSIRSRAQRIQAHPNPIITTNPH